PLDSHACVPLAAGGGGKQLRCGMPGLLREVGAAAEDLETSVLAAVVERPVGVDDHVPDLARRAVTAAVQAAVDDEPAADAGRPRDVDHGAGPATRAAMQLPEPRHVATARGAPLPR